MYTNLSLQSSGSAGLLFTPSPLNTPMHIMTEPMQYNIQVNHKKRDILFLTITLANLNRFL